MTENVLPSPAARLAAAVWLILLAWLGVASVRPPAIVPENAPAAEFSAARAMKHLRAIAARPHPVGSPENQKVREYLVEQLTTFGLDPQVQPATGFDGGGRVAGAVYNILARKKGATPGKALLLLAHYDSVSAGPGAGDDGAGVAALLETARALNADPAPLRNDVLFLFTDGEEAGLLGAEAFVAENPAAKQIGLALNFEGRGDSGPSLMFETSDENGWLIRQLAAAAPFPMASSLSYAVYKGLPNDTDLSVFKRAGLAGMNFAFIGSPERYHTPRDTPENLDPRSLQHHGSYALALARHFGNEALENRKEPDHIYFHTAGIGFIAYPQEWAVPLAVSVALLFLVVSAFGFWRSQLPLGGIAFALLAAALSGFLAWRGAFLFMRGLLALHLHWVPYGPFTHSVLYGGALLLFVAALTAAVWELFRRRAKRGANWQSFAYVGLAIWVALTVATSFYFPAGSYLCVWPALFNLIALGMVFAGAPLGSRWTIAMLMLGSAPAMLFLAPLIRLLLVAFGLELIGAQGITLVVLLLLWIETPLILGLGLRRWVLVFSALGGVVFLSWGAATVRYTRDHPHSENIFYLLDADSLKSVWINLSTRQLSSPDEWAAQYVSSTPEKSFSGDYFAFVGRFPTFQHEAPQLPLQPPEARMVEESSQDGKRTLHLSLRSPRHARQLQLIAESDNAGISLVTVNGKSPEEESNLLGGLRRPGPAAHVEIRERTPGDKGLIPRTARPHRFFFHFTGLPEAGFEITLEMDAASPLRIMLTDFSDGLPEIPGQSFRPRPEHISMQHFGDATLVSKKFLF